MAQPYYIGDSKTVTETAGVLCVKQEHSDGSSHTIRMDPLVVAQFLGWLENSELFKDIPRGFSNLVPETDPRKALERRYVSRPAREIRYDWFKSLLMLAILLSGFVIGFLQGQRSRSAECVPGPAFSDHNTVNRKSRMQP